MAVDLEPTRTAPENATILETPQNMHHGDSGEHTPLDDSPSEPPTGADTPHPELRFRIPQTAQVISALALGLILGGYVVHRHDNAQVPIAVVNGYIINKEHFFNRMQEAGGAATMHEMVTEELQLQYAKKLGALPSKDEVDARYAQAQSDPGLRAQMISSGQSEQTLKRALEIQLAQSNVLSKGVKVTSADVMKFYNANIDHNNAQAQFYEPATVSISAIECHSEERAQQAADDIQLRLDPFEEVARQYSEDPTGQQGGRITNIQYGRTKLATIPGMQDAIFGLRVGQMLGPARFAGSWWLIKCDDKSPSTTVPFNKVKDECVEGATIAKGLPRNSTKIQTDFELFQKNSKIRAIWPQYTDAVTFK